ncbi:MAG: hypothetical protein GY834_03920, partial [Bacteroidetes bacterium]|nr:hypothetical protein [Bacteroidota bacterium]
MRNLYFFILGLFVSLTGFAQNGAGFNYQAIVRDITGDVKANVSMNIEVFILQESVDGTVVFTEAHAVTSNAFGLVNLSIGSQNPSSFDLIDWGSGSYFLRISIDGVEFGTSQLMRVPYALHAKTAENYNETDPLFSASPFITLTQEDVENWNSKSDETDPYFSVSIAEGITSADIARWNNFADGSVFSDIDNDTKIQVEESSDEDIIRFDMAGTEHFRMNSGRLEVDNTGSSVFIGDEAGANDDFTDNNNVAIGDSALYTNTTGGGNTAIGNNALHSDTAQNNTAIGNYALYSNTSGVRNTAIGRAALQDNTEGKQNTALGFQAGLEAEGSGNIFLGYQAGKNETGSNKLYIDNSDTIAPLIYGDFAADSLRINGDLKVSGTLKIEGGSPKAGYVLTSDANGLASWSNSNTAQSALWADSAIYADTAQYALWADSAIQAIYSDSANHAIQSDTAQYALLTDSAIYADTAQYALWADSAIQ